LAQKLAGIDASHISPQVLRVRPAYRDRILAALNRVTAIVTD